MEAGEASVIVAGAGALAGTAAVAVAQAGFGRLGLLAPDGADAAAAKLGALVPDTVVEPYPVPIEGANAEAIVAGADVVLACGEAEERLLLNEACCATGVSLVAGSVSGRAGTVQSIRPGSSACALCAQAVIGGDGVEEGGGADALAGVIGAIAALEALRLTTMAGEPLLDRVLTVGAAETSFELTPVTAQAGCPACARVPAAPQS